MKVVAPHKIQSRRVKSYEEIAEFIQPMHEILKQSQKTVALHHSQVADRMPLSFFIIKKTLCLDPNEKYATFCNAKIHTIDMTFGNRRMVMEGCRSFPFRSDRKVARYQRIKVSYDMVMDSLNVPGKVVLKHEEAWVEGLVAQIFQHEIAHSHGELIY